jgi:hypothetical protein
MRMADTGQTTSWEKAPRIAHTKATSLIIAPGSLPRNVMKKEIQFGAFGVGEKETLGKRVLVTVEVEDEELVAVLEDVEDAVAVDEEELVEDAVAVEEGELVKDA